MWKREGVDPVNQHKIKKKKSAVITHWDVELKERDSCTVSVVIKIRRLRVGREWVMCGACLVWNESEVLQTPRGQSFRLQMISETISTNETAQGKEVSNKKNKDNTEKQKQKQKQKEKIKKNYKQKQNNDNKKH